MVRRDHSDHQHRLPSYHPYGIVRKEGQPHNDRRKTLTVHWHPSVLQRQRAKRRWQIISILAILFLFLSFTLAIYKLLGCDISTGDCTNLYTDKSLPFANNGRALSSSSSLQKLQQPATVAEMFADPDHPYAHGKPYPAEEEDLTPPRYAGQILDLHEEYSPATHEEGIDDHHHPPLEHHSDDDSTTLEDDGNIAISGDQTFVAEDDDDKHDDGGVIDVEPEDENEDAPEINDGLTHEPDVLDSILADTSPHPIHHHHILNTGSSTEADIWNGGQELLTDDDFIELDGDYVTISTQDTAAMPETTASQSAKDDEDSSLSSIYPPPPSILTKLDPGTKYLTYLPYAGITNQFYGMLRALVLAKRLGRTLIVPPITASSHDKSNQQQPWSAYFDLGTFTFLTNVKIVELHELKDPSTSTLQPNSVAHEEEGKEEKTHDNDENQSLSTLSVALESLPCLQTAGFGSKHPLDFTAKEYLRQWEFGLAMLPSDYSDEMDLERLATSIEGDERFRPQQWQVGTTNNDSTAPSSPSPLETPQQLLCITNAYKISVTPKGSEWDQYGRHFYFSPLLERFYVSIIDKLREDLGLDKQGSKQPQQQSSTRLSSIHPTTSEHDDGSKTILAQHEPQRAPSIAASVLPQNGLYAAQPLAYISIHARREDFIEYCKNHFTTETLHTCLPSTEHLAATLSRLQARNAEFRHLPVLVSTNERRPEELAKFKRLGWHVVDYETLLSQQRLLGDDGTVFGPIMVDQILMARAQLLIGVRASAFSRIGALRQMDWYNRRAFVL